MTRSVETAVVTILRPNGTIERRVQVSTVFQMFYRCVLRCHTCPPEVGALCLDVSTTEMIISPDDATHIEAISAMDKYTKEKPTNTMRNAHITPAVPPLVKMLARVVSRTSHVAINVQAKPTIEVNWKFLWKTC